MKIPANPLTKFLLGLGLSLGLGLGAQAAPTTSGPDADKQFFPIASYRVGPYASAGIQIWAGRIDYFRYLNEVEGGINGVKLVWQECETEWTAEKGIECYERFKNGLNGAPVAVYLPNGAPAAYALTDRAAQDKIPLITLAYGRTEAADGRVFPYIFPVMLTFYSEASALINYIAEREGGHDQLKGKKIATVYHDSAYGRETIEPLKLLAEKYGFENIQIPVADPGNEQSSQWRQVRQAKPDWVFLRTWGVSTPVAIKTAARFGFPADRIIGDVWASSEEDVIPAGEASKGYLALTPYPAGTGFDIHQRLKKHIIDTGKSDLKDLNSFGSVYYNSGLVDAIVSVEAVRTAQARFGNRPINGEEGQWGLENLKLDEQSLKKSGFHGLVQNLELSCGDHEGGGAVRVQQWDGQRWNLVSDWVQADRELLQPLIDAKSAAYAREKGITPRDCGKEP
ncbi:ABC transporter substrate-binding protein [Stutzerimonas kirkiae]|uniref:ABC transporter permease n=1 Tax=Stutzerimonas kirkiae TaxID=2211392 RepID=A0A4Q9RC15_9GAMM|nr:ABC transporter substrate-binding protein [Stutzerimonas kirkiae]TBU98608.1 ABC transporter permease [Stutzerimonas kirkiae]TBV04219.1 ABC transporter permease [Stutzerimonas kirkiae]TBV10923.1 ABC transporter permease [Stutzerimonas kirkiae]TBV14283.1 ABC transporter permease [Stutzerimonas kirkiae]